MKISRNSGTNDGTLAATPDATKAYQIIKARLTITKLLNGPAKDTDTPASLGFLKKKRFTGTGRAQPNPATKIKIVPIGSKCFIGFKVNLPCFLAVSSPNFHAAKA